MVMWLIFLSSLLLLTKASKYHQNDYTVKVEIVEVPNYNRSYARNVTCGLVFYNRTYKALNASGYLFKDLSLNLKAEVQFYTFLSNEYRFFPIPMDINQCKELERDNFGKRESLQQSLNILLRCPIKRGFFKLSYGRLNFSNFPPYIPGGRYKATVKLYDNFILELDIYAKVKEVIKKWEY